MMSRPLHPIYCDDHAAREYLESLRWPRGPVCPHCGSLDNAALMRGRSTRPGVWKCRNCRKPFSVTVGTVLERSRISLSKWLLAMHLLSTRKGMNSRQLHLRLGVTYKSALLMTQRIRREWVNGSSRGQVERVSRARMENFPLPFGRGGCG